MKLLEPTKEPKCKGRFYRLVANRFMNKSKRLIEKTTAIPLRKISCKGCEECSWMDDNISEDLKADIFPKLPRTIKHGALYELTVVHESRDWESGYTDDIQLGFVEVTKKLRKKK